MDHSNQHSNQSSNRRRFLETAAAGAGAAWLLSSGSLVTRMAAQSPESRVDVLLDEPVGTIAPEIYGHFVEHLGGDAPIAVRRRRLRIVVAALGEKVAAGEGVGQIGGLIVYGFAGCRNRRRG